MRAYAALALLLPACSAGVASPPRSQPAPPRVEIVNYTFAPKELRVAKGTRVTWVERDEDVAGKGAHTVAGDGFGSALVAKGTEFAHTFDRAGTFAYICGIHQYMTGTVTVDP